MYTFETVIEYDNAIRLELHLITHQETRILIEDLLEYAAKAEKEAENRDQRPRPDGTENAAYYRAEIDINHLPTESLRILVENLLKLVEILEQQIYAN